jgi:hypothetical protein
MAKILGLMAMYSKPISVSDKSTITEIAIFGVLLVKDRAVIQYAFN